MNKKSVCSLMMLLYVSFSAHTQTDPIILCETPDVIVSDGRNGIPRNYIKSCRSGDLVPFVVAEKNGYKTRSSILNNSADTFHIPPLLKIPFKESSQKFIRILHVDANSAMNTFQGNWYASPSLEKREIPKKKIEADYRYYVSDENFEESLIHLVGSFGFTSNTNARKVIGSYHDLIYLNAVVKSFVFDKTTQNKSEYGSIQLTIEWSFETQYSDQKVHFTITSSSDQLNIDRSRASYNRTLNDAIEYNLMGLLNKPEVKELLKLDMTEVMGKRNVQTSIKKHSNRPKSLKEQLNGVARIRVNDKVISSGTIISANGYIITDYSIIAYMDSTIEVEVSNSTYVAKVIANAEFYNLALLKIEVSDLRPVSFPNQSKVDVTDEIFAIGYSKIKLLNSYATSGHISGIRNFSSTKYYQTDLPLSEGNNGGAVLNEDLECIGIINSKINSVMVEGIGFITPIEIVLEALNVEVTSN